MQAYCVKCCAKKRDEGYEEHNYEEWQAGDSGDMSRMWDQDV